MNEINNNIPHIITGISSNSNKNVEPKNQQINEKLAQEFVPDTGILGMSQVAKPDNIQSDIEFCTKTSPEFLNKCDKFFENALSKLADSGEDNAYEKACVLTKEFANEFV